MRRRDAVATVALNRSMVGRLLGELVDVVVVGSLLLLLMAAGWALILWWWLPGFVHFLIKVVLIALLLKWADRKLNNGRAWAWLTGQVTVRTGMARPSAVYRFYDRAGLLLYVGKAVDPEAREQQHRNDPRKKHWTRRIHSRVDEWFPSEAEAFAAESRAIDTEDPWFNQAGNG